jgi:hypothetical protein
MGKGIFSTGPDIDVWNIDFIRWDGCEAGVVRCDLHFIENLRNGQMKEGCTHPSPSPPQCIKRLPSFPPLPIPSPNAAPKPTKGPFYDLVSHLVQRQSDTSQNYCRLVTKIQIKWKCTRLLFTNQIDMIANLHTRKVLAEVLKINCNGTGYFIVILDVMCVARLRDTLTRSAARERK